MTTDLYSCNNLHHLLVVLVSNKWRKKTVRKLTVNIVTTIVTTIFCLAIDKEVVKKTISFNKILHN